MTRLGVLVLALVVGGCQGCRPGEVDPFGEGFKLAEGSEVVDFGRVREGDVVTRRVVLVAETRSSVLVTGFTQAPFSTAAQVTVPGAGEVEVEVQFTAGYAAVTGQAIFSAGEQTYSVTLTGTGVRPLQCVPSAPCVRSMFSIEEGRCIETPLADGDDCEPTSRCLTAGKCHGGECKGVARDCKDNNPCTQDLCAPEEGCINPPLQCPPGSNPCKEAVCVVSQGGCTDQNRLDGTVCGATDCVNANLCVSGTCTALPTPEGTVCAPKVACVGESTCQQGRCETPDAGPWEVEWSASVAGDVRSHLRTASSALYLEGCGLSLMLPDGGVVLDAGCGYASFTSGNATMGGIERHSVVTDGGRFVGVGPFGVFVQSDEGLHVYSRATGALQRTLPALGLRSVAVNDRMLAALRDEGDGGSWLVRRLLEADGGLGDAGPELLVEGEVRQLAFSGDALLGLGERTVTRWGDAGVTRHSIDAGYGAWSTANERILLSGRSLLRFEADGGLVELDIVPSPDAGSTYVPEAGEPLFADGMTFVRYRRCPTVMTSCLPEHEETWVRVLDATTGGLVSEAVIANGRDITVADWMVLQALAGTFAAVVTDSSDGGMVSAFQMYAPGARKLSCVLPAGAERVRQALVVGAWLLVLVDGQTGLELKSLPLHALGAKTAGWPTEGGLGGLRTDRL